MEFSELAAESSDEGPCGMLDHSLPRLGVHGDRSDTGLFPVECVSESVQANNDMKRLARISLAAFEELGISYSISDTFIQGGGYPANSRNPYVPYFEQAAPGLVPVLLHMLINQDGQDQGINTLYSPIGSGRCLCLVAQIIGDTIIPLVEPFFELNIESPEWRHREAATHALGSICAGPTWEKLTTFLGSAFKRMLKVLEEDSNKQVKYTGAWTFRKILEFQHRSPIEALVVTETNCEQIVNFLISSMTEVPNVAEDACYAFYFLARCQHAYLQSILSPYSEKIVQSLCTAAHRNDAVQSGLRIAALEALIEVMWSATAPVLLNLIVSFLFSLRQALDTSKPSRDEREVLIGCRSLQVITQRVRTSQQTESDFMEHADDIMDVLLMVFECKISPAASKEAMVAVRSVVQVTGRDFEKYMPKFCKHWIDVLHNFPECEFYSITVDVMINICSALNKQILSYCDGIIPQLVEILLDADLCEDLRPPILSCFGELALSIGADFYHYLRSAMHALRKSKISVLRVRDTETATLLKCGVLEAYCGIFQCFKHPSNAPDLSPYAAEIVDFLCLVCQTDMDARVITAAIRAIGDFSLVQGDYVASLIYKHKKIQAFLKRCLLSNSPLIKFYAQKADRTVRCATYELIWHDLEAKVSEILFHAQRKQPVHNQANKVLERSQKDYSITLPPLSNTVSEDEEPEERNSLLLLCLSSVLSKNEEPVGSRILAGQILLKDWGTERLEPYAGERIMICLLQTLFSSKIETWSVALKLIEAIALFERPFIWLSKLVEFLSVEVHQLHVHVKRATLETLRNMFKEGLDGFSNSDIYKIFIAVDQIISESEGNNEVKLAALQTVHYILDLFAQRRELDLKYDHIVKHVLNATKSPELNVKIASFECLVSISSACYNNLGQNCYDQFSCITLKAMREDEKPVPHLAIEFWSSLCYREICFTKRSHGPCSDFVKQAFKSLVSILLNMLATLGCQDEDDGAPYVLCKPASLYRAKASPNLAVAAGRCLGLVAQTVGDDIIPFIRNYVGWLEQPESKQKEIGSILQLARAVGSTVVGPNHDKLKPLVDFALPKMLDVFEVSPDELVKYTAAWTLRQVFEFQHYRTVETPIFTRATCKQITTLLLPSMKAVPNVAKNACYALCFLARGLHGSLWPVLAPCFGDIVQSLHTVALRNDVGKSGLRIAAYEALQEVVRCATDENAKVTLNLVTIILEDLRQALDATGPSYDERVVQKQCGILKVLAHKLGTSEQSKSDFFQHVDDIIDLLPRVLACSSATAFKEAILMVGALAYVVGPDIEKYMPELDECWKMGLQNIEEGEVTMVTLSVIVDVCSVLKKRMLPSCGVIMTKLIDRISYGQLDWEIWGPIISCIGEIAGATCDRKYLEGAMNVLHTDVKNYLCESVADIDLIDDTDLLRPGMLGAYCAIFQGFRNHANTQPLIPFVDDTLDFVLRFLSCLYKLDDMDYAITKTAVQILEDLAFVKQCDVSSLIEQSTLSKDFMEDPLIKMFILGSKPYLATSSMVHCEGLAGVSLGSATGYKLGEVLAVHIKSERTFDLYGTIIVNSSMGSQCIYKREREDPDSINSGDTALFINALEEFLDDGGIDFEVDLRHRKLGKEASLDDEVCKGRINWKTHEDGCNEPFTATLNGKNGSVKISFAEFNCATTAYVRVSITNKKRDPRKVHGQITAYSSKKPGISTELFRRENRDGLSLEIKFYWRIDLCRGLLVSPLSSVLYISANLWEYDEQRETRSPFFMGFADFNVKPRGSSTKFIPASSCDLKVSVSFGVFRDMQLANTLPSSENSVSKHVHSCQVENN